MSEPSEANWRRALLPADSTIRDAIHNLDASHLQVVLVISSDGLLVGTITDGDIRRGLLRGLDLGNSVGGVVHHSPFVAPPQMDREMVLHLMQVNKIRQLPVVDANRRVVGLHVWDQIALPAERPNLIVIMAGGRGTRLRPHTESCPKPLLPVAGKPMLEHIIERAKAEGFGHFVLAIHYLGHMIEDYFGDGARWQVRIDYLREEGPLGTAGALSLLSPRPDVPFAVSNGDVLTDIRYGELLDFNERHNATATMAVRVHEWQHPFGVVTTRGVDIVSLEEKPINRTHVNAGIYALDPSALDALAPAEPCDMPTLFERLQALGKRTVAYAIHEPWLDVGKPDDLDHARNNSKPDRDDRARKIV